jgi:hypothetical protein
MSTLLGRYHSPRFQQHKALRNAATALVVKDVESRYPGPVRIARMSLEASIPALAFPRRNTIHCGAVEPETMTSSPSSHSRNCLQIS